MSETAAPDKPEHKNAAAKQDKPVHARFARLVAELGKLEDGALDARGAALLLAHMCTERGRDKVLAMKPGEAGTYLLSFRARYPLASQALEVCDVVRFVYRLGMYDVKHDDEPTLRRALLEILPPPPKPEVDLAAIAAQAAQLDPKAPLRP